MDYGLLQALRSKGLGVSIRHRQTHAETWVGALMYADDLVMLASSPGELQLMMNVITEYAHKWRFEINDAKTKVMCMCETKPQRQLRVSRWGETWQCGGRTIAVADAYVYLGVTITPNLDFFIHISQLHHKLQPQKREAALLGVRSGGLPIDHAIHLWQAYVEPKFAYARVAYGCTKPTPGHIPWLTASKTKELVSSWACPPTTRPAASRRRVRRCLKPNSSRRMSCA